MPFFSLLIEAARPKTLLLSIIPVLIGSSFAMKEGHFSLPLFFLTLFSGLSIQIATNYANDYFDALKGADTAERIGPRRVMQNQLISPKVFLRCLSTVFLIAATLGSILSIYGGIPIALLAGLSLTLALIYTAGPLPLAYLGLGEVFVMLFFGPIATSSTFYLQTHSFSIGPFFGGLLPGSLSCIVIALNNLRDIDQDRKVSKKTIAVRFGEAFAKKEILFFMFLAYLTPCFFCFSFPFAFLPLITLPLGYKLTRKIVHNQDKKALNPYLFETTKLLLYMSVLFAIGIMLK